MEPQPVQLRPEDLQGERDGGDAGGEEGKGGVLLARRGAGRFAVPAGASGRGWPVDGDFLTGWQGGAGPVAPTG